MHLMNRSPAKYNKTPIELMFRYKSDFKKIKMFGCVAYRYIHKHMRDKFDPTSEKCIFMGYDENVYRLWVIKQKNVILGRNVIFNESQNIGDVEREKNKVEAKNELHVFENDSDDELLMGDVIDKANE